jgi:glutamine synthetase
MVGSSQSIGTPNFVLNAIVADTLIDIADRLEKASDFTTEVNKIVKEIIIAHKRIVFNGNNYAAEWVVEAEKRGLPNLKSTIEAIPAMITDKNIHLFDRHGILSPVETHSRYEIQLESYVKTIRIEALTMIEMVNRQIIPATMSYVKQVADTVASLKAAGSQSNSASALLEKLISISDKMNASLIKLQTHVDKLDEAHGDSMDHAKFCHETIIPVMNTLREEGDKLETIVDSTLWPFPTYGDMLFKV